MTIHHVYPGKSISDAVNNASLGDIVYLRDGTFTGELVRIDNIGTAVNPIYVLAYPGESPIIDGQYQGGTWDELVEINGAYIVFDGIEVKRAAYSGIIVNGTHVTIRNVYSHHNTGTGIHVQGDYGLVELCKVYWNSVQNEYGKAWYAGKSWGAGLVGGWGANYVTLRNNIVYNNWGEGLSARRGYYLVAEDNIVYDNFAVQLYTGAARHTTIQRNLVYDTDDPDFSIRKSSCLSLADEDNYPLLSEDVTIINNLVVGGGRAFRYSREVATGMIDCLIAYNTFCNSQGSKTFHIVSGSHSNTRIENNIILEEDPAVTIAVVPDDPGLTFDHNLWSKTPIAAAQGPHDVIANPLLAKTGEIAPGELTREWFRPLEESPAFDAATPNEIDEDYEQRARDEVSPTIGGLENAGIPPPPEIIVDFETGDLTQFDSVETSGDDFSAHADAAMEGSYGGKCIVDDTSDRWGQVNFADKTRLRVGFYFDPNYIAMDDGDAWNLVKSSASDFRIRFAKAEADYTVEAQVYTDASVWSGGGAVVLSDEPHWIEADFKISSAPGADDGFAKIWIDPGSPPFGAPDSQATSMDNDQKSFSHVRVGAVTGLEATTSGIFYVDYITVNDTGNEIGAPLGTPIPVMMRTYRNRRI